MEQNGLLNDVPDISKDFFKLENNYFFASRVLKLEDGNQSGLLEFRRYSRKLCMGLSQASLPFKPTTAWEFPVDYGQDLKLPFSISFLNSRTIRLRISARNEFRESIPSLIIEKAPDPGEPWECSSTGTFTEFRSECGSLVLEYDPLSIILKDSEGRLLTKTQCISDTKSVENAEFTPFSVVRRSSDTKRRIAASFSLSPGEKIFGCGESFTRLDKRGQKQYLYTVDAKSVQTLRMYKPIPFFISSRGYGMFIHSSALMTFDIGCTYDAVNTLYIADDQLDLFIFLGTPKEILAEYTALTGRSTLPPLWSFGLWMSRNTYRTEEEVRYTAAKLREYKIPCDVIHLDPGWMENGWLCNLKFSTARYKNPALMLRDLLKQGFHVSLWQLPYLLPGSEYMKEAVEKGYAVLNPDRELPTEDAVIDFSNPEAVKWYQDKLKKALELGAGAIKADFGEAAPLEGVYASGKSGFHEHNLYPLRYNKALSEITKEVTGESIIWARSAWAGSQRYPLHWGGDTENTDCAMLATLRGGLSLGLCGFSFWSHDIGGFVQRSPEELYRRWLPFGMLTSHSRCHGTPPKEPWEYSEEFIDDFRRSAELKYSLLPYIYTQARLCSEQGFPMIRTLFFEYPDDHTAWFIEDEYLFGTDILVAPLFEEGKAERMVYLPEGLWIDYQSGAAYTGGKWHRIPAGLIPAVILVKDGTAIMHVKAEQSTMWINWGEIEIRVYNSSGKPVNASLFIPGGNTVFEMKLEKTNNGYVVKGCNMPEKLKFNICEAKINYL